MFWIIFYFYLCPSNVAATKVCSQTYVTVPVLPSQPHGILRSAVHELECGLQAVNGAQGHCQVCPPSGPCGNIIALEKLEVPVYENTQANLSHTYTITGTYDIFDAVLAEGSLYAVNGAAADIKVERYSLTGTKISTSWLPGGKGLGRSITYLPWIQKIAVGTNSHLLLNDLALSGAWDCVTTPWAGNKIHGIAPYMNTQIMVSLKDSKVVQIADLDIGPNPPVATLKKTCNTTGEAIRAASTASGDILVTEAFPDKIEYFNPDCQLMWSKSNQPDTPWSIVPGREGTFLVASFQKKKVFLTSATQSTEWLEPPTTADEIKGMTSDDCTLALVYKQGCVKVYEFDPPLARCNCKFS